MYLVYRGTLILVSPRKFCGRGVSSCAPWIGRMAVQQGRYGQYLLIVSAVVLCICGIVSLAMAQAAKPVWNNALSNSCEGLAKIAACISEPCLKQCDKGASSDAAALDECKRNCKDIATFDADGCVADIKRGINCQNSEDYDKNEEDWDEMYCEKERNEICGEDKIFDCFNKIWGWICDGLGALGAVACILFTGIPAAVAAWKRVACCNVVMFSVCSGIWSLIFLVIGAAFIFIALQFNPTTGEMGKFLQDICTIQEFTGEENWDDDWDPDVAGGIDCAARSLCIAVRTVAKVCCVCGCNFTHVRRYAHARARAHTHTHTHTYTHRTSSRNPTPSAFPFLSRGSRCLSAVTSAAAAKPLRPRATRTLPRPIVMW